MSDSLQPHGLYTPPGSSVHGILQARTLEWVVIPFSQGSPQPRDQSLVSSIADRFFTIWATRETHHFHVELKKHYELVNKIKKQQTHKYREQTSVDHWEGGGQCKRGEEKRKKG